MENVFHFLSPYLRPMDTEKMDTEKYYTLPPHTH